MRGEDILKIAKKHIGEKYVFGAHVPMDNDDWKGPWDCAEFVSWCVYQTAGTLYGCDDNSGNPSSVEAYTGFWAKDAKAKGVKISAEEASLIPGAAILRVPQPGAGGHIAISDGKGGTVEAYDTKSGVIASVYTGRRWDMGILIPGIDFTRPGSIPVVPAPPIVFRLTSPHMQGKKVREIQAKLKQAGFMPGKIDGSFGPFTASAVFNYQLSKGLLADGEVGPKTAKALGISLLG